MVVYEIEWKEHSCCVKPHPWEKALYMQSAVICSYPCWLLWCAGGAVFQIFSIFICMISFLSRVLALRTVLSVLNQRQQECGILARGPRLGKDCGTVHSSSWADKYATCEIPQVCHYLLAVVWDTCVLGAVLQIPCLELLLVLSCLVLWSLGKYFMAFS